MTQRLSLLNSQNLKLTECSFIYEIFLYRLNCTKHYIKHSLLDKNLAKMNVKLFFKVFAEMSDLLDSKKDVVDTKE